MRNKLFKSVSTFWKEFVFIVSIALVLFEFSKSLLLQHAIDGWDIALLSFVLPLLVCLIGQLFWKNKTLSIILSVLLALASFAFILMAFYSIGTSSAKVVQTIFMLILGVFLFVTSLLMPLKEGNVSKMLG